MKFDLQTKLLSTFKRAEKPIFKLKYDEGACFHELLIPGLNTSPTLFCYNQIKT